MSQSSVGDSVRVKFDNPGGRKRMPKYTRKKVGVVQKIRGRMHNPRDHRDERLPIYSVLFPLAELDEHGSTKEKVVVDVFEDWMTAPWEAKHARGQHARPPRSCP